MKYLVALLLALLVPTAAVAKGEFPVHSGFNAFMPSLH